ncbi:hypothetical protein DHEL01_v209298 [Diaporthe helianthi]|uniref:Uncharacterized protein n=1 Tax=Diaporthe helianthi TaxID=158607 RepID=A0A2P5HQ14_DIAHE|nr:hypothetical protein DHEL01_v209298 [Diaporthe helianthi]
MRLAGSHALHDTSVAVAVTWFWWWDGLDSWTSTAQRSKLRERTEGMTRRGSGKAARGLQQDQVAGGSRGKPELQTPAPACADSHASGKDVWGDLRRLSILHALVGPRTTFQRHEPHRKDRLDLEGGSDEQGTQYTNK